MNTTITAALTVAALFGIAGAAVVILYGVEAALRRIRHWQGGGRDRDGVEP